jgi:hypothetical protein
LISRPQGVPENVEVDMLRDYRAPCAELLLDDGGGFFRSRTKLQPRHNGLKLRDVASGGRPWAHKPKRVVIDQGQVYSFFFELKTHLKSLSVVLGDPGANKVRDGSLYVFHRYSTLLDEVKLFFLDVRIYPPNQRTKVLGRK